MPTGPTLQHHALSPGAAPMPSRGPASALGKRPLLADALHEAQLNGATSSSASANANSELGPEYLYPPLDVDIVANIVRALAEVPHFYTQTLHLMNKLHLPAPFGPQKHTTASTRARGAHHLGPQPKRRKKALTAPDDDLSTDESELESDAEEDTMQEQIGFISSAVHAFQKVPTPALPTSKKHDTIQIKLGGGAVVSGTATTTLPTGAPSSSAEVAVATPSTSSSTTTEPTETRAVECAPVRPLTSEELAANRMPVSQLLQTKGYDKYQPGTPSHKLHLKNLHRKKEISPSELLRLFGSFVAPGQSPNDIEIKVMTGRMSGQAFVTLASQELATQALAAVHGYVLHGLPILVEYGREAKGKPMAE